MKTPKETYSKAYPLAERVGFDFRIVSYDTSIVLLRPLTQEARNWIHDHVRGEKSYLGENLCVEPRYIIALVEGIAQDGLTIAPLK